MTIRRNPASPVLQYIRRIAATQCPFDIADRQLLDRFITQRDEAAYAGLVHRHGPMVLGLCLRILHNEHDAEDAFQATFLVLIRKANSLVPQESLGGWLYGVAYRIAQKARIDAARRRKHERRAAVTHVVDSLGQIAVREAQQVLDKELARLPDKFRVPLVLCYLEGLSRDEAAKQLCLPPSTLKSRLEQARERLRARLASRGLALGGALVASIFSEGASSAALPSVLLDSTVETAMAVATAGATTSVVPAHIAALAEGVMKAMFMTKLKIAMAVLLALASFGTVARIAYVQAAGPGPEGNTGPRLAAASVEREKQAANDGGLLQQVQEYMWFVNRVDGARNTIYLETRPTIALASGTAGSGATSTAKGASGASSTTSMLEPCGILMQVGIAEDAEVIIDGEKMKLADVQRGMQVSIQMAQDQPIITRIDATTPGRATLKGIDVEKRAITVSVGAHEWTAPLAADAKVFLAGKQNAQLSDLSAGMRLYVSLGVDGDKIVVTAIWARGL